MRFGIGVALALSILMILGAGYLKAGVAKPLATVVSVSNPPDTLPASTTEEYIATSTPESKPETLSTTDLVARQLLMDYLGLASNGQTDPTSLQNLANKYVDQIAVLAKPAEEISPSSLQTVPDSSANYLAYDNTLSSLNQNFVNSLSRVDKSKPEEVAKTLAASYALEATELKSMPVPLGAVSAHIKIIANYETLAKAYGGIFGDIDPSQAFANLYLLQNASSESDSLWKSLASAIKSHE